LPLSLAHIQHVEGRVIVVFVVAVLHGLYIGLGVSRATAAEGAKSYARQLIFSCETLMAGRIRCMRQL
jgi:hypothetical protein